MSNDVGRWIGLDGLIFPGKLLSFSKSDFPLLRISPTRLLAARVAMVALGLVLEKLSYLTLPKEVEQEAVDRADGEILCGHDGLQSLVMII